MSLFDRGKWGERGRLLWKVARVVVVFTSPVWVAAIVWQLQPPVRKSVRVVDYTVPFVSYAEHTGLLWLLDHLKVTPPDGHDAWDPARDYIGYRPTDREHPQRLADADLEGVDWVYVADTYGVYREDLHHPETQRAHDDFSKVVFGGFDNADAAALEAHVDRGGSLFCEFNSFAEPTRGEARHRVEALLGVGWTGWAGHVFEDLWDEDAVPRWVPRLWSLQFPGREMPRSPSLVLIGPGAELYVFPGPDIRAVMPVVRMTAAGRARFGIDPEVGYFHWFSFVEDTGDAEVLATLELPDLPGLDVRLARSGLGPRLPFLTEKAVSTSRRLYLAGDMAEVDFNPGWRRLAGLMRLQALFHPMGSRASQRPVWWRFYAPVIERTLAHSPAQDGGLQEPPP